MKIISPTLGILVSLLVLGVIGYAGVAAFEYLGILYQSMEPQVVRVVTIASAVAVFCALIVASGLKYGGQNVSSERIALYQQLLGHWAERLEGVQNAEERIAGNELAGLEPYLALHGSPKVIAAYMNLRNSAAQEGKADDELRELLKKLVMEMRADIGRAEFNLKKNDLLDLLLGRK